MSEFKQISKRDSSAYTEIVDIALDTLQQTADARALQGYGYMQTELQRNRLGINGFCIEASDAVTRAAHSLGIVAAREWHGQGSHYVTSFASLNTPPDEADLILCMTWGQFDPHTYTNPDDTRANQPYFGERRTIADLLPASYKAFSSAGATERQIVHRPGERIRSLHEWLRTTPEQVASGAYAIEEVDEDAYPDGAWIH